MHVLTVENEVIKHYEYALDWIENKGFDWCVHSTIPAGTEYWLVDDETWSSVADLPTDRLGEVFDISGEPDGVSIGRKEYEEANNVEGEK